MSSFTSTGSTPPNAKRAGLVAFLIATALGVGATLVLLSQPPGTATGGEGSEQRIELDDEYGRD